MSDVAQRQDRQQVQNYIDGEWVAPSGTDGQDVVNPATGKALGYVGFSTAEDVATAAQVGQEIFEDWSSRPVVERIQPVFEFKQLLKTNFDELAELLVKEHGKALGEAQGELRRGIENVEVACGIPSMMHSGTLLNAAPEIDESAVRKPLGVFAGITPFNFPGMIPLWFLPYAVATGNAFILKPSERDPMVASRMFELLEEAGFPDGIVQLVHGSVDTVDAILENDVIQGVSFVGSTPVARHVYSTAAQQGKRAQAQGGAKNYIIVTESADVDFAAEQSISSALACAGERCLANDIALVSRSVYDEYRDSLIDHADAQQVGYGLDEETDIGALITPDHRESVLDHIETGLQEGATLLRDGRDVTVQGYEDGTFLGPTIFEDVTVDMALAQEEIFGPVFGLVPVDDMDDAIQKLNGTDYGNAASLFTGSGADARTFRHDADVGNLGVNVGTAAPMAFFHFGGTKDSFFGDLHAQGEDMIQFYTDKTIYIERWPESSS